MTDSSVEAESAIKRRKIEDDDNNNDNKVVQHHQCQLFIKRKNRYCSMQRKATEKYCSEHMIHDNDQEGKKKRVPCPLDPTHTVWEYNLKKHVKKCNTRPSEVHDEWYELDVNSQKKTSDKESGGGTALDDKELYAKYIPILRNYEIQDLEYRIEDHSGCWGRIGELKNQKHALQQLSLIGNLRDQGLLSSSKFYVEFGCGKAELSRYVNLCIEQDEKKQEHQEQYGYGLIDRGVNRMKMDKKILSESSKKPTVLRSLMDIKDFSLAKFQNVCKSQHIVGISKHLCGAATDLTLNAVLQTQMRGIDGILIAMCCRHVCLWDQLLPRSRDYLTEHGFPDEQAFYILKKMVSWAISGVGQAGDNTHVSGLTVSEREELGLKARRLVDQSRVEAVIDTLTPLQNRYRTEMFWYTTRDITLENVALLIKRIED